MRWANGTLERPPITSPFGPRPAPVAGASTMHRGTDFVGYTLVRAIESGQVTEVGVPRGWAAGGTQVWVQHAGFLTRSMHLASVAVKDGQFVREGDVLGVMGRTGNVSGVHHHLEVVVDGIQVDPVAFITNRLTAPTGGGSTASEEDDVTPEQDRRLEAVYQAIFGAANVPANTTGKITWAKPFGETPGEAYYGLLDVAIYSQQLAAQNAGVLAALQTAISQLSAGSGVTLDMAAIEAAAERGAKDALAGLVLTAATDG